MKFSFLNLPVYKPPAAYQSAISKLIDYLGSQPGVSAIYQMGSMANPGISDVDMIAIFEDQNKSDIDPIKILAGDERYLFTHSVFGISESHFAQNLAYSAYHHYEHLWGKDLIGVSDSPDDRKNRSFKKQIALEYLLANLISRTRERFFKIINVRGLLLSAKALRHDLDFLEIEDDPLRGLIGQIVEWRDRWFSAPIDLGKISAWFEEFLGRLETLLKDLLRKIPLYVPRVRTYRYSRNIILIDGPEIRMRLKGFTLPAKIIALDRNVMRLNKLFSAFELQVPMREASAPGFMGERFAFFRALNKYQRSHFPGFTILANPFVSKLTASS